MLPQHQLTLESAVKKITIDLERVSPVFVYRQRPVKRLFQLALIHFIFDICKIDRFRRQIFPIIDNYNPDTAVKAVRNSHSWLSGLPILFEIYSVSENWSAQFFEVTEKPHLFEEKESQHDR